MPPLAAERKAPRRCCPARLNTAETRTPITITTMMVAPRFLRSQVSQLCTTSSTVQHHHRGSLTCRSVTQIPLQLRESHLGEIQRRSVPLQERADLREARAERRAGAPHHRRSSHLSRRREIRGEGCLLGCDCSGEMNGGSEGANDVKVMERETGCFRENFTIKALCNIKCIIM